MSTNLSDLDAQEIEMYPNPVKKKLKLKDAFKTVESYEVVDVNGAIVSKGTLSAGQQEIDVRDLADGMYFFKIASQVFRFVKQ